MLFTLCLMLLRAYSWLISQELFLLGLRVKEFTWVGYIQCWFLNSKLSFWPIAFIELFTTQ